MVGTGKVLPRKVVEADMTAMFRRHLDRYINRLGKEAYSPGAQQAGNGGL